MVKILTRSGASLADIYDVQGSIAGIDQLETRELPIMHEMGSTVFSERFSTTIRRAASGDLLQTQGFNILISNMPTEPTRILGIAVITDDATRLVRAAVMARDPRASVAGQEFPIWQWDATNFTDIHFVDAGDMGSGITYDLLRATFEATFVPTFSGGSDQQPDMVSEIVLRGLTATFGAGTVFIRVLLYVAFAPGFLAGSGVSSRGLPIPSW